MEIAILSVGLPTGPNTLDYYSLGGSETAGLSLAKEFAAKGHLVNLFCNLPKNPRADFIESGTRALDGVRYIDAAAFQPFIQTTAVDLLIVSRVVDAFNVPHQAKKSILWLHDLAMYGEWTDKLNGIAWNFNEIWAVSEWHKIQINKVTGYPLDSIKVTRNGIVKYDTINNGKGSHFIYAARPERGLENLVKPGGIMEHLPHKTLVVAHYDNPVPHLSQYYDYLFARCRELPNVELVGSLTQKELRQTIQDAKLYVYPTNFEEVSCILARECMSVGTPMVTTRRGALPETLNGCGIIIDSEFDIGSDDWCKDFAEFLDNIPDELIDEKNEACLARKDLYWSEVADDFLKAARFKETNAYSVLLSLIEDSDIIPAIAYYNNLSKFQISRRVMGIANNLRLLYPYLFGDETYQSYYARYYEAEVSKGVFKKPNMVGQPRFEAIAEQISQLKRGSRVLDYGCAEGVIINDLAKRFPDIQFVGLDFAKKNIEYASLWAKEDGINNVEHIHINGLEDYDGKDFDAAICSEVLEHVEKPWELIHNIELRVKENGSIIITVPAGPWEMSGLKNLTNWFWRAHIWHIDKWMLRSMFKNKNAQMHFLSHGHMPDGTSIGHYICFYKADHKDVLEIDPLDKIENVKIRQTTAACLIAQNDEATIINCLNSIHQQVSCINIALGKSTDGTEDLINKWADKHPWVNLSIVRVASIEPYKFGFDDARNASIKNVEADWILWIDTDEYLSGDFRKYTKRSAYDSFSIHQHHFTVDPRGAPAQLDKPARLFRNNFTFHFYGKVHEHAEKGFNNGPGFAMLLPDVDIGHIGYVNENVRRHRFFRNFPLLEWDRKVYPDRKLGKFLWLRDIIHRMRWALENKDTNAARQLALEAVQFHNMNGKDFENVGGGFTQSIAFISEALAFLGSGMPVEIIIRFPDRNQEIKYGGVFDSVEKALNGGQKFITDEFNRRKSGYWAP